MSAFTPDRSRGPFYVPLFRGKSGEPVHVHFPVLTPDNGIIMCTTEADQYRVAYDLNRLTEAHERMRGLLEELLTARPLLLYGDEWIARIDEVLGES
jgi:hypothetical protein